MRKKAAILYNKKNRIEWRSHEPSRLETFSDAVFAFAVTLIIVSLEVPKSFSELYETMKGTVSFAACFAILFSIWNDQNKFFRRYGLNDSLTVTLNALLLFVVLIYVYPLKFLAVVLFMGNSYTLNGHTLQMVSSLQEVPTLMLIYGLGFAAIYLIFCLLYANANKHKKELNLTEREVYHTKTEIFMHLIMAFIGFTAAILATLLPLAYSGLSGYFYFAIPLGYFFWLRHRAKKEKRLFDAIEPVAS